MDALIDEKMQHTSGDMECIMNDAVEATFFDALNCEISNVDDNKQHGMYLLMQNVFVDVVKGGRIQELIGRLAARTVT